MRPEIIAVMTDYILKHFKLPNIS